MWKLVRISHCWRYYFCHWGYIYASVCWIVRLSAVGVTQNSIGWVFVNFFVRRRPRHETANCIMVWWDPWFFLLFSSTWTEMLQQWQIHLHSIMLFIHCRTFHAVTYLKISCRRCRVLRSILVRQMCCLYALSCVNLWLLMYDGRCMIKLQSGIILLIFQI